MSARARGSITTARDGEARNAVRIPNDPEQTTAGPFAELQRLQTELYTRLTEETFRYLRRLQAATAPAVPGTVLMPDTAIELCVSGTPGTAITLYLEVENRQRVHCFVTPMFTPLVAASGAIWFPAPEPSLTSLLLAPEEVAPLSITLPLPANMPSGAYRGALLLQGFREGAISILITATSDASAPTTTAAEPEAATAPAAHAPGGKQYARPRKKTMPKRSQRTLRRRT
jgi:hypothetical protein